jgi:hypothetical protein
MGLKWHWKGKVSGVVFAMTPMWPDTEKFYRLDWEPFWVQLAC